MDKILVTGAVLVVVLIITMLFIVWGWSLFMIPVFGMQPLTFSQAFGFALLAQTFGRSSVGK